jgi:hypothetical protein
VEAIRKKAVVMSSSVLSHLSYGEMRNNTNEGIILTCQLGTRLRLRHMLIGNRKVKDSTASDSRT